MNTHQHSGQESSSSSGDSPEIVDQQTSKKSQGRPANPYYPWTRKNPARILIIDGQPAMCEGLTLLINRERELKVCGHALDSASGLNAIDTLKPDLVILELSLCAKSGLEVLKLAWERRPKLRVLIYSASDEDTYCPRVLRAGAGGYLLKSAPVEELMRAVRQVLSGEIYLSQNMGSRMLNRMTGGSPGVFSPIELLTDRELEVFTLLGQGEGVPEIAGKLNLGRGTVRSHCSRIREKLGLTNSRETLRHAIQWTRAEFIDRAVGW